jgi:hypothetical protein
MYLEKKGNLLYSGSEDGTAWKWNLDGRGKINDEDGICQQHHK